MKIAYYVSLLILMTAIVRLLFLFSKESNEFLAGQITGTVIIMILAAGFAVYAKRKMKGSGGRL